jgi:hypothetical protein
MTTKLYIEDLICNLAGTGPYLFGPSIQLWQADYSVVQSLGNNPPMGKGFTEKQRNLVLRLCKKYESQLSSSFGQDVKPFIDAPEFKFPLVQAAPREKSVKVDGKKLLVKFPFNEEMVNEIRKFRDKSPIRSVAWDGELNAWVFAVEETNLMWIENNLLTQGFHADDETVRYIQQISEILEKIDEFCPMLVEEHGQYVFKNVHKSVPQLETNDLIEALTLAKYYGISVWDETVSKRLETSKISPIFEEFLNESKPNLLEFDSSTHSIDQFEDLFKHTIPALIIIPGTDELSHLKNWVAWLKSQNFKETEISVMFRLDNATDKQFNEFVKESQLNTPVSENTKIVFISQKVPKPLIKSGLDFKLILNLGTLSGVHYSLSNYLQDRSDVIRYTDKNKTGYQFGLL